MLKTLKKIGERFKKRSRHIVECGGTIRRDDRAVVLQVRTHPLDRYITVDLGRLTEEGNLDSSWLKSFCVILPSYLSESHLADGETVFITSEIPEDWNEYILGRPESKCS